MPYGVPGTVREVRILIRKTVRTWEALLTVDSDDDCYISLFGAGIKDTRYQVLLKTTIHYATQGPHKKHRNNFKCSQVMNRSLKSHG